MAAQGVHIDKVHHVEIPENNNHHQKQPKDAAKIDYSVRAQWLRAAVLRANEGLVSIASLIMEIGVVKRDVKDILLVDFAGLVSGACSMAIGEYVSVNAQLDIEIAHMKRDKGSSRNNGENNHNNPEEMKRKDEEYDEENHEKLPNPMQAALASAVSFSTGGLVPLLSAAVIRE
ncbi:hypothetical protein TIFTF001_021839 [Ficus carica]|uniref:Vacuolar iron transporter n=1 Tax=Ficus carica TaxID=3494 RepID=A0AA88AIR5_FICCA|nr:hypothetical protein TIFTF001_021839 [Ficus carica]